MLKPKALGKQKSGTHDEGGRIYRALSEEQKEMGVRLRYIPWKEIDGED
jgi:hypothetical protein